MADKNWLRSQAGRVRRRLGGQPPAAPDTRAEAPARTRDALHLEAHPWFDAAWYRGVSGARGDRAALVDHYLETPAESRLSPHPLFDPVWFADHFTGDLEGRDPFFLFTRRKRYRTPFHPLFSLGRYRRLAPDAAEHEGGPLGHYLAHAGEPGAVQPNAWWPETEKPLHQWLVERAAEHRVRQAASAGPNPGLKTIAAATARPAPAPSGLAVDVVLNPGGIEEQLRRTLESLLAQTETGWHVLVATGRGWGFDVAGVLDDVLGAHRWTGVDVHALAGPAPRPSLDSLVVDAGTAEWIAFLDSADTWSPTRLASLLAAVTASGADVVSDVMVRTTRTGLVRHARSGLVAGDPTRAVRLARARLLLSREAWESRVRPGWRSDLPSGHEFAMVRALAAPAGIDVLPVVGVHRDEMQREEIRRVPQPVRPVFDHGAVRAWDDVVLRDRLVDLEAERLRPRADDVISVIVPTYADTHMTMSAVESVMDATAESHVSVQVIVVDNGCRPDQAALLDTLSVRWNTPEASVEVLHADANLGFALGNDLAIPLLRGATTVFLNNDTDVATGWLEPLLEALRDPLVLGAQSLLRYPDGSVQCAGIAFTDAGGVPHGFAQWHPVEDVAGVGDLRFHALTAACLAMRTADVVTLGGFDPVFNNGMEDIDLCLRAAEALPAPPGTGSARFVVCPASEVRHHESVSPGRFRRYATNRRVFLDRWRGRLPADDVELWHSLGFEVIGHVLDQPVGPDRVVAAPRSLVRRPRAEVTEQAPRLRWAIKNPAPSGALGDRWGDTHFADSLAAALRDAGQEVVVDRRDAWERRSSSLDDVSLVLRGLTVHNPAPDQVNLAWVISHPDVVTGAEAATYDRVFAASTTWAARQSERWGFEVEAMLQATDRTRFHPDLAAPDTGHPVLFVGSSRRQQRPLVRDAVEANLLLSVYGTEWNGMIPPRFVKAQYLDNREVGAAYRSAGVVLNDHWEDMRLDGFLSNRLFDAAAAGARIITDDVAGLGDLFGRSVQVARSADDLVRLATSGDLDGIFGDDAERRAVAGRIHAEHSFTARAERLVQAAVELHRARGFDRFR